MQGGPLPVDLWWNSVVTDARLPLLLDAALVLDRLGAGVVGVYVIPLGAAVALAVSGRTPTGCPTPWAAS